MDDASQRPIHSGGITVFKKRCSGTDLKNIHSVTVQHASRKIVNAGFSFRSCQQTLRTSMRTKVTKIKIKLCGTFWMDQPTLYIHLWSFQKDLWAVST